MFLPRRSHYFFLLFTCLFGCSERDQIRHYTVARMETAPAPKAAPSRMLGGLIARDKSAWFFKLTGPPASVETAVPAARMFLKSIRFSSADRPEWTLPEGWTETTSTSPLRYKTLLVPASPKPLELTVSELSIPADPDEFALSNLNRWRGQLGLAPIAATQMQADLERIECEAGVVLFVDLVGQQDAGTLSGMGGLAGGTTSGSAGGPPIPKSAPAGRAGAKLPFRFQTPAGWEQGGGTSMSLAAFQVQRDGQRIAITFTPAGGDLAANINRWRGQIGLAAQSPQEIQAASRNLTVDGHPVVMADLVNKTTNQAVIAAILQDGETSWFITIKGGAELALAEQANFEQLIQSIRFEE